MSSRLNIWLSCRRVRNSGTLYSRWEQTLLLLSSLCSAVTHRKVHVRLHFSVWTRLSNLSNRTRLGLSRCSLHLGSFCRTNWPTQTITSLNVTFPLHVLESIISLMTKCDMNPDIISKSDLLGPDMFRSMFCYLEQLPELSLIRHLFVWSGTMINWSVCQNTFQVFQ